ncbi:MAG: hypothetical protein J5528_06575 [Firmicutes bacterium]|nr:hypothetical protein [Bacillota bacterium]
MSKVYDFMKDSGMLAECFDDKAIEADILADIEEKRTIGMIKTYQKSTDCELPDRDILAIDAGGTNLRFAEFKNGAFTEPVRMPMFGIKEEITADKFFDLMAYEISKYDAEDVGFCFSYPCEILENKDGKIVLFAKEVKIKNAKGKIIGKELNKRLAKQRNFSIINDTAAAQLGTSSDIGIILGTGFNICFTDRKSGMIINSECGQYEGMPFGKYDKKLCKNLNSPKPVVEKLISGAYLGGVIKLCADAYFGRRMPDFELKDVSELLIGEGILYDFLNTSERNEFREMVSLIQKRGAHCVALMLKCLLKGYPKGSTLKLALEGSTVYKMPGYHEALKDEVSTIPNLKFEFVDARGTLLTGCVRSLLG